MNGFTTRTAVAAVLAASALALTGCGAGAGPSPSSSPSGEASSPAATVTPTATGPAETEPAVDPGDITTWTVSEQGIGPARIGEPFAEVAAGLEMWRVDSACAWTAFLPADDGSVDAYFVRDAELEDGEITTVTFEALADSVVSTDGPRTAQGIGLGSTRDEITTAHPDAAVQQPTIGGGELLRVGTQGSAAMYFAIREGASKVTSLTVTDRDEPPYEVCA